MKSWKSEALFYAFEIFSRAERRSGSEKRERQKYDFSSNSFPQILRNCIKVPQATLSTFSLLPAVIIIFIHQQLVGLSALAGPMVQAVVETTLKKQPTE